MAFLFDKFKDMFKEKAGEEFTKNEKEYMIIYFANSNPKSSSKTIFYSKYLLKINVIISSKAS